MEKAIAIIKAFCRPGKYGKIILLVKDGRIKEVELRETELVE